MKYAAATLLFATLTLASQLPTAPPEASASSTLVMQPNVEPPEIETYDNLGTALEVRVAELVAVNSAGFRIEARNPRIKIKTNNSTITDNDAAGAVVPTGVLLGGVIGLGVIEIVRIWG